LVPIQRTASAVIHIKCNLKKSQHVKLRMFYLQKQLKQLWHICKTITSFAATFSTLN
jgi:hypothetical protein